MNWKATNISRGRSKINLVIIGCSCITLWPYSGNFDHSWATSGLFLEISEIDQGDNYIHLINHVSQTWPWFMAWARARACALA